MCRSRYCSLLEGFCPCLLLRRVEHGSRPGCHRYCWSLYLGLRYHQGWLCHCRCQVTGSFQREVLRRYRALSMPWLKRADEKCRAIFPKWREKNLESQKNNVACSRQVKVGGWKKAILKETAISWLRYQESEYPFHPPWSFQVPEPCETSGRSTRHSISVRVLACAA